MRRADQRMSEVSENFFRIFMQYLHNLTSSSGRREKDAHERLKCFLHEYNEREVKATFKFVLKI